MRFLAHPNIPSGKVRICAVGEGNAEVKYALEETGISVLEVSVNPVLAPGVDSHADMQLHDMGEGRVAAAKNATALIQSLKQLGFSVTEQELAKKYPSDIALNCFVLGKYLYGNKKGIGKILLNYYQSIGVEPMHVNQGYAKCSTCIVDKNSIITADITIAKAARSCGVDVLVIQSGGIRLNGYDAGFIGGCCGLIAPNRLAFSGKLSQHSDYIRIKEFCEWRGVALVELTGLPLTDIGGIIPLVER